MKSKNIFLCLVVIVFIFSLSCAPQYTDTLPSPPPTPSPPPSPPINDVPPSATDAYPTVSTTISPSTIFLWEDFILMISAEDDRGIKSLSWKASVNFADENEPVSTDIFACDLQKTCSNSWNLSTDEEGTYTFIISAVDSSGQETGNIRAEVVVYPARAQEEETPPTAYFTCGNGVCEGGESYQSCSNDCVPGSIIGTNPGNGACEPGEDADNAPNDCTVINKQCGNNICDEGEDRSNCYYDCQNSEGGTEDSSSCSSNSACGYRQRCEKGTCVSVECTSDSQCTGCRRCSSYECVNCGYGVEGYCTC